MTSATPPPSRVSKAARHSASSSVMIHWIAADSIARFRTMAPTSPYRRLCKAGWWEEEGSAQPPSELVAKRGQIRQMLPRPGVRLRHRHAHTNASCWIGKLGQPGSGSQSAPTTRRSSACGAKRASESSSGSDASGSGPPPSHQYRPRRRRTWCGRSTSNMTPPPTAARSRSRPSWSCRHRWAPTGHTPLRGQPRGRHRRPRGCRRRSCASSAPRSRHRP
jgi:hypothetical protein